MTDATYKFTPATAFPSITWPTVQGGKIDIAGDEGWRMLVVYRGKHCPLCKRYFKTLNGLLGEFKDAGVNVSAVSADPKEKAEADVESGGWQMPVGYGLTVEEMRRLGLYISEPRSPQETDRPFSEPGIFVVNPKGQVQIIDISNAPFSRPDLQALLSGIKFVMEKDYPVRGTLS